MENENNELVKQARSRLRANIVAKLREGKTLTTQEQKQIGIHDDRGPAESQESRLEHLQRLRTAVSEHSQTSAPLQAHEMSEIAVVLDEAIRSTLRAETATQPRTLPDAG